ncbi:hypothetical protein CR105_21370 [Massilia eurypsychrophila]|uniref:Uncharacterized protein n=1 Tax=Massilia eurypsychrophila TaxID=1485217 RepID=A0A2G8TA32_9BURK|nr:hypothetical protein CR105_21370 [Massilia eurypsychrophila]
MLHLLSRASEEVGDHVTHALGLYLHARRDLERQDRLALWPTTRADLDVLHQGGGCDWSAGDQVAAGGAQAVVFMPLGDPTWGFGNQGGWDHLADLARLACCRSTLGLNGAGATTVFLMGNVTTGAGMLFLTGTATTGAGLLLMTTGAAGAVNVTLLVGGAASAGVPRLAHRAAMIIAEREVLTSDLSSIKRPT